MRTSAIFTTRLRSWICCSHEPTKRSVWAERARNANLARPYPHAILASAYALKGDVERAGLELAEARSLRSDGAYSSIARNRAAFACLPKICALREATLYVGLRKAGMPEEGTPVRPSRLPPFETLA